VLVEMGLCVVCVCACLLCAGVCADMIIVTHPV
jgi:hypothetical protein